MKGFFCGGGGGGEGKIFDSGSFLGKQLDKYFFVA